MTGLEPFLNQIVTGLIAFVVGGGFAEILSARRDAKAREREADALEVKTEAVVTDMSMASLIKINEQLTADYNRVSAERDDLRERFETLSVEVQSLREKLEQAQRDLAVAHTATAKLQKQLIELMESLPESEELEIQNEDT